MPNSLNRYAVVLLVEDQEEDVLLIRLAFKHLGIPNPVYVVRDGDEAVHYLEGVGKFANRDEYPLPSLVLLDLKLPRRNGFDVLKWIRNQESLAALRVIVLTNSELKEDVNYAYYLGANSFMTKPTEFNEFVAEVEILARHWLSISRAPDVFRPFPQKSLRGKH